MVTLYTEGHYAMPYGEASTKRDLMAELMRRGMTLRSFAVNRGYNYVSVMNAVNRFWGKPAEPQGIQTDRILSELQKLITS